MTEQIAFGRAVTEAAPFAWLCNVIVSPSPHGQGPGKALIAGIVADLKLLGTQADPTAGGKTGSRGRKRAAQKSTDRLGAQYNQPGVS